MLKQCFLFLAIVTVAWATPATVDLEVDTLTLKNGKVLRQVLIKSYDSSSGRVVLMVNKSITTTQLEMLPPEVIQQIKSLLPPEPTPEEKAKKAASDAAAASRREAAQRKKENAERQAARKAEQEANAQASAERNAEQNEESALWAVKSAAKTKAYDYFRYEYNPGSGSVIVTSIRIQLDEPEPMSGWTGRYRAQGKALFNYYAGGGGSFNNTSRAFEVEVEKPARGSAKVVAFSLK